MDGDHVQVETLHVDADQRVVTWTQRYVNEHQLLAHVVVGLVTVTGLYFGILFLTRLG
jgi:hypothetical protein